MLKRSYLTSLFERGTRRLNVIARVEDKTKRAGSRMIKPSFLAYCSRCYWRSPVGLNKNLQISLSAAWKS
jgi:hypothetical protein